MQTERRGRGTGWGEPSREAAGGGSDIRPLSFRSTLPLLMKVALRPFPGWAQPAPRRVPGEPGPGAQRGPALLLAYPHQPPTPHGKEALRSSSQEPGRQQGGERASDATHNPGSSSAAPGHLGGREASSRSRAANGCFPSCSPQRPLSCDLTSQGNEALTRSSLRKVALNFSIHKLQTTNATLQQPILPLAKGS